jgi:hypothetical protein
MQPKAENRIMIYDPKDNGSYWVEFKADQGAGDLSPNWRDSVLRHFRARMPYGLVVPAIGTKHPP